MKIQQKGKIEERIINQQYRLPDAYRKWDPCPQNFTYFLRGKDYYHGTIQRKL